MRIKMNTWLNTEDPANILLYPNPFRDFSINPISMTKVDALIEFIKATDFWDNVP